MTKIQPEADMDVESFAKLEGAKNELSSACAGDFEVLEAPPSAENYSPFYGNILKHFGNTLDSLLTKLLWPHHPVKDTYTVS